MMDVEVDVSGIYGLPGVGGNEDENLDDTANEGTEYFDDLEANSINYEWSTRRGGRC